MKKTLTEAVSISQREALAIANRFLTIASKAKMSPNISFSVHIPKATEGEPILESQKYIIDSK